MIYAFICRSRVTSNLVGRELSEPEKFTLRSRFRQTVYERTEVVG